MRQQVDIAPPTESLYGKKRKGTSSAQNATAHGKEAHDVGSLDDSDPIEDEQNKNGVLRSQETKTEEVVDISTTVTGIKLAAPNQRVS